MILMDIYFDKIAGLLGNVEFDISAAREHVGEVERPIQTIK